MPLPRDSKQKRFQLAMLTCSKYLDLKVDVCRDVDYTIKSSCFLISINFLFANLTD